MFHHTRSVIALSLIAAFVITGCRFNPQAAKKVAERSRATAQAANASAATEAKAVVAAATSIPVQPEATSAPVTSVPTPEPTAVVAALAEAPANATPVAQSSKSLLPAVSNAAAPSADAPVAAAAPAVDVPAAAPASVSATTPKMIERPVVHAQPKEVSQRPKRTQTRVVRPKVTVVHKEPVVRRSLFRVGCVIASNVSVNRRKNSSLSAAILGRVAPRARFVALARSKTGRWLFGVSRGRTGWVAASTLSCGADTRRLTVRAR